MTNRELFSALGQLDDDLILAAAPQSRRHSSPMLLRWGALAAGLVLAVGIAFAVAPRLPAILPPNTDTSHIQGTTNTTDQTDSADTETDSSTDTNTDSSTDTSTDSTDSNVTEEKRYAIYVELSEGAGEIKLPEGNHDLSVLKDSDRFSYTSLTQNKGVLSEDQKTPVTLTISGKQIQVTPTAVYESPFASSKNETLRNSRNKYYEFDNKSITIRYTNENQLLFYMNRDYSKTSYEYMNKEQLITNATKVLEEIYGKEFVSKYTISSVKTAEDYGQGIGGTVNFMRMVHGYSSDDWIAVSFQGFELHAINAKSIGLIDVATDVSAEDIRDAENYLTQTLKLAPNQYWVTIDTDGDLFLKARTEDAFYWISIE